MSLATRRRGGRGEEGLVSHEATNSLRSAEGVQNPGNFLVMGNVIDSGGFAARATPSWLRAKSLSFLLLRDLRASV